MTHGYIEPNYPQVVLSFEYQGWILEIDQGRFNDQETYAVWANHAMGCSMAVPYAASRSEAIARAKTWVNRQRLTPH